MKLFSLHCVIGRVQQTYEGKRKFLKEETEALRGEVIYPLSWHQGAGFARGQPCLETMLTPHYLFLFCTSLPHTQRGNSLMSEA